MASPERRLHLEESIGQSGPATVPAPRTGPRWSSPATHSGQRFLLRWHKQLLLTPAGAVMREGSVADSHHGFPCRTPGSPGPPRPLSVESSRLAEHCPLLGISCCWVLGLSPGAPPTSQLSEVGTLLHEAWVGQEKPYGGVPRLQRQCSDTQADCAVAVLMPGAALCATVGGVGARCRLRLSNTLSAASESLSWAGTVPGPGNGALGNKNGALLGLRVEQDEEEKHI
ncbi:PREDICTED: uncharacterized protein LOC106148110 [Chinchilla lanigera]|uniref:uncharacterized protein LOC106148110 n=1 Tax=Chinchilla lanigera TaxID=34839 RepID=UPI000696FA6E|nr:PREDICTED: uncharacterized protein LOC106148110 [Chinchilla lanigera]